MADRNTADAVLELFPQVVRALRAIEWTTEDVNNTRGRLFCPECGRHSVDCPCDDCPGEVVVAPNGGHDDECTIGRLLAHPVVHAIPDEEEPRD